MKPPSSNLIIFFIAATACYLVPCIKSSNVKSTKIGYKVNSVNTNRKHRTGDSIDEIATRSTKDNQSQYQASNGDASDSSHGSDHASSYSRKSSRDAMYEENISRDSLYYRVSIICRAIYLFIIYFPAICTAGIAYFSQVFRDQVWFTLVASTIARSGAAFIKWGQWASTRSDMFPEALCIALSQLQANAPVHSFSYTQSEVLREFGQSIDTMFDSFEEYPIASGSIAQVYRAVYNKQKVAVKVRHPNVEMQIKMDFDIMNAIIVCIENFFGLDWLNLSESMIQFSHTIASQTDLEVESYHLHLFEENFRGWKVFNFPKPILTRKSIIIESFLPGDHVSSLIDLVKQRSDGKYPLQLLDAAHFIVTRGEDLYLKMLIQDNLMHADMHPGNIFLQLIPKKPVDDSLKDIDKYWMFNKQYMNYEIGLVDAGMVAILTESEKRNFIGLLEAMGEGDGFEAADCVLEFSLANRQQKMQSDDEYNKRNNAFKVDMSKLFKMISRGYGTNVDIGEVLRGILTLIRKHRITIDTNYATLVMNALCLDSLAKSLLPSYSILDGAKLLLRLNRRAKRLPLFVRTIAMKVVFPTMLRMKQMQDQWFLRKTKVDHALL